MNLQDITQAKDPDLRASAAAMLRAAALARQTAIQTDTQIVLVQNHQLRYLSAEELQKLQQLQLLQELQQQEGANGVVHDGKGGR